jgi:initiation factor 1A
MVRNEGGGNKMKHLARKHVNGSSQSQANKFLRVAQSKEEIYAYILRILGNSMCMVKCVDGYERLCHIRGKFTGRSKRENALAQGTWVLIGLRQWDADKEFASKATKTGKKIQKCDLLEIYSASEREKLRVQEKIFQDVIECNNSDGNNSDGEDEFNTNSTIEFKDTKTLEYQEIVAQGGKLTKLSTTTSYHTIYDQISDDDDSDGSDGSEDDSDGSDGDNAKPAIHAIHAIHDIHAATPATKKQYSSQLEEVDIDDI